MRCSPIAEDVNVNRRGSGALCKRIVQVRGIYVHMYVCTNLSEEWYLVDV